MSIGTPAIDRLPTKVTSAIAQEPDTVSVDLSHEPLETSSLVWDQIDLILRRSLERPTSQEPSAFPEATYYTVAPGIMMRSDEYEERYSGIDLAELRDRMPPELFKAFIRHIGSVPGHPDLDVCDITTIVE